jgi:hypothetical protein
VPIGQSLTSLWDGLSPHLIASFYPVTRSHDSYHDSGWIKPQAAATVLAPLTEASMEVTLNWQSPFESAGPESRAPALMAMLQSGQLQPILDAIPNSAGKPGLIDQIKASLTGMSDQFVGRTGITKLNSTQVFSGMPPVKIQATAVFRAWRDAVREVEAPFDQLMQWALPASLSPDGSIFARLLLLAQGKGNAVDALVPSFAPVTIAMRYKNRIYSPLVIESSTFPLDAPITSDGHYIELVVPMTLCSLTAIDRQDWANYRVQTSVL